MKLFGNTSGSHVRRDEDQAPKQPVNSRADTVSFAAREDRPVRETPAPAPQRSRPVRERPAPPPRRERGVEARAAVAVLPERKKHSFLIGYLIYIIVFLLLIGAGLTVLWLRMDAYEKSRPYKAMDALMSQMSADDWRGRLSSAGVEDSYIDSLDLQTATYVKKLGEYTDQRPVYSIRFGKKPMFVASLKEGQALRFGYHAWEPDSLTVVDSDLTVFAPEGAVITVHGQPVGPESVAQRNAQPITLGPLEADRSDIPGLTKYVLTRCYAIESIEVFDAEGNALAQSYSRRNAYYYPPLTSGYVIEAPSAVTVKVNGIALTEENSEITRTPLEDFEGLGDSVPVSPAELRYVIDGLMLRPNVEAVFENGDTLAPTEETEEGWVYRLQPDPDFAAEQESYILTVFDAYIAFLGNRDGELYKNYQRYQSYLLPGSDAAKRAEKSLDSLYWVSGRDTALDGVELGDVIRYGDNCFTAWLDFTRRLVDGGEDNNSYLFIFVRSNGQWRVARVMNKTSFFRQ